MIILKPQEKKNPTTGKSKFYPQIAPVSAVTLSTIVPLLEKRSTMSSADVKAFLDALQFEVIEHLKNGHSVRLGDIGSWRLTLHSKSYATEAELKKAGAAAVKSVTVVFTKGATLQSAFDTKNPDLQLAMRIPTV